MVGQNNQNHNYWSNQFLGGLTAPQGNPGGDEVGGFTGEGAINMNNFGGEQFFCVAVPEPSTIAPGAAGHRRHGGAIAASQEIVLAC